MFQPATKEEMIKYYEEEKKRYQAIGGVAEKVNMPSIDEALNYWRNK